MGLVIDQRQVLEIERGIDLGRGDAGVPEHLLHGAQVARGLQHVRGKRVAQHVRMHGDRRPGADAVRLQPQLHHAGRDTVAAFVEEQGAAAVGRAA